MAATVFLTFYRTSAKRGALLADVAGVIVHDHWKPYVTMQGILHALCNAHHLRELKALMDIEKEPWAFAMFRFLRQACHAVNVARRKEAALARVPQLAPVFGKFERFRRRKRLILRRRSRRKGV